VTAGAAWINLDYFAGGNVAGMDNTHFGNNSVVFFGGSFVTS
jgi:hypothetical protein